jgi:hypothetical protein
VLVHERLEGEVDRKLLGECLVRAVREHDAFRMRFAEDEGMPRVRLVPDSPDTWSPALESVDLSGAADPGAAARAWCERELGRPLEVRGGPMFQAALLVEGPTATHLVIKAHHIITDAWALNAVTSRILSDYQARSAPPNGLRGNREKPGTPAKTADAPSYWEAIREYGSSSHDVDLQGDREYYQDYLAGITPARPSRGTCDRAVRTVRKGAEKSSSSS